MVPACYPSKISSTTGLREAVVFALPSVTGLVRWTDYIPVKLVASADAALEGRTDAGGFIPMDMLSSNTGLMGWVDYLPVYVDNSATDAWVITAAGFIPYAPSGGISIPSFYLNLSNASNATILDAQGKGTVTSGIGGVIAGGISVSRLSGVAPLYVNFDYTGTISSASANPAHECFFATDFGDSGAGVWANGVQSSGLTSKNAGYGPVTGHVYETPGTYHPQVVVIDGAGNISSSTATITVQDPNLVYAGALTICVSHSGNFTGAPSGATQVNTAGNTDMYAAWNTHKASNKRILFCKADSWTCSATVLFSGLTNAILGGYGTGSTHPFASETMVTVTPTTDLLYVLDVGNSTDSKVCSIKVNASGTKTVAYGSPTADTVAALLYKFEVHGTLSMAVVGPGSTFGVLRPHDQHCIYECYRSDSVGGSGGQGGFVAMRRGGIMGSYFDNSNNGEQSLRIPYIDRGHINNNYIARPNKTKNVLKIHSRGYDDISGISNGHSEKFVVSANVMDLRGGYSYNGTTVTAVGTPSLVIGNGSPAAGGERVRDGIVENNFTYGCLGNHKDSVSFAEINCSNMTVRNNIADFSMGDRSTAYSGTYIYTHLHFVSIATSTPEQTAGVRVYNNTLYSNLANAETAFFARISSGGANPVPDEITIKNNIWYTPFHANSNRTVKYDDLGLATNVVTTNNTDNGQTSLISPNFVATPPVSLTDWRPNTGSYAINTGVTVPVLRDFNNVSRYGATYDLGAVLP